MPLFRPPDRPFPVSHLPGGLQNAAQPPILPSDPEFHE